MYLYLYPTEHRIILSKNTSLHRVYICELHSTLAHVLAEYTARRYVEQGLHRLVWELRSGSKSKTLQQGGYKIDGEDS